MNVPFETFNHEAPAGQRRKHLCGSPHVRCHSRFNTEFKPQSEYSRLWVRPNTTEAMYVDDSMLQSTKRCEFRASTGESKYGGVKPSETFAGRPGSVLPGNSLIEQRMHCCPNYGASNCL